MCVAYILKCHPLTLYNQTLADVRETGAGITCLYCTIQEISLISTNSWRVGQCYVHKGVYMDDSSRYRLITRDACAGTKCTHLAALSGEN